MKKRCLILLLVHYLVSCTKMMDEPPAYVGPVIQATLSIRELRARHTMGGFEYLRDEEVIEGIVVADDRSDNFYKSIVLQDSTGGITIRLDGFALYNDFSIGTRMAIKLKELWMGDYGRMIQLGAGVDRSAPSLPELIPLPMPLYSRFLVKKSVNNPVVPLPARIETLGDSMQSCLVQLEGVEFAAKDTGTSYADVINQLPDSKVLKACSGGTVYVRTSGFARFASAKTPRGNGSLTGIYTVFRNEKQLLLRDTADVQMRQPRCAGPVTQVLFNEDFEGQVYPATLSIKNWKNITEAGSVSYLVNASSGNRYAAISAFATGEPAVISWLVLPPLNLGNTSNEFLSFETKDGFDNGALLQVMASTNYDGGNTPWKARWTVLRANISKGSVTGPAQAWLSSGPVSLSGYKGTVYLAFRYEAADSSAGTIRRTTRFQIDNIRVQGN